MGREGVMELFTEPVASLGYYVYLCVGLFISDPTTITYGKRVYSYNCKNFKPCFWVRCKMKYFGDLQIF